MLDQICLQGVNIALLAFFVGFTVRNPSVVVHLLRLDLKSAFSNSTLDFGGTDDTESVKCWVTSTSVASCFT